MSDPTISDIRKAAEQLRKAESLRKPVKYYKCEIKNWPLFYELMAQGKIHQTKSGCWELS